jgi:hypothetical protein
MVKAARGRAAKPCFRLLGKAKAPGKQSSKVQVRYE